MSPLYRAAAGQLLAPLDDQPVARAQRTSGLYAALYLEDPFLFYWCGLASFVARQVYRALEVSLPGYQKVLADGNKRIYEHIMPLLLQFRAQRRVDGQLGPLFERLAEAESLLLSDPARAFVLRDEVCGALSEYEQRNVVQEAYAPLPRFQRRFLAKVFCFRMSFDSAGEVIMYRGKDPTDVDERLSWMKATVLPAWARYSATHRELVRADCERIRREAEVRLDARRPTSGQVGQLS